MLEYFDQNNQDTKKFQKLLNTTVKKISKNKKYQLSTKDIILLESFKSEGFLIPKEINYTDQLSQFKFSAFLHSLAFIVFWSKIQTVRKCFHL